MFVHCMLPTTVKLKWAMVAKKTIVFQIHHQGEFQYNYYEKASVHDTVQSESFVSLSWYCQSQSKQAIATYLKTKVVTTQQLWWVSELPFQYVFALQPTHYLLVYLLSYPVLHWAQNHTAQLVVSQNRNIWWHNLLLLCTTAVAFITKFVYMQQCTSQIMDDRVPYLLSMVG